MLVGGWDAVYRYIWLVGLGLDGVGGWGGEAVRRRVGMPMVVGGGDG